MVPHDALPQNRKVPHRSEPKAKRLTRPIVTLSHRPAPPTPACHPPQPVQPWCCIPCSGLRAGSPPPSHPSGDNPHSERGPKPPNLRQSYHNIGMLTITMARPWRSGTAFAEIRPRNVTGVHPPSFQPPPGQGDDSMASAAYRRALCQLPLHRPQRLRIRAGFRSALPGKRGFRAPYAYHHRAGLRQGLPGATAGESELSAAVEAQFQPLSE